MKAVAAKSGVVFALQYKVKYKELMICYNKKSCFSIKQNKKSGVFGLRIFH